MNAQTPFSVSPRLCGSNRRGFTLVEMLVAVFIALIIFSIGFTLLSGATQARSDAQARIRATDAARIFFDNVERDLADAVPGPWTTPYTKSNLAETPGGDVATNDLKMTTTGESTTATMGFVTVRYYVLTSTKILYRETAQDAPPGPPSLAGTPAHNSQFAMLPDVESLTCVFYRWDDATKAFVDATGAPDTATHINVQIQIKDPSPKQPLRTFQKLIAIPASFTN